MTGEAIDGVGVVQLPAGPDVRQRVGIFAHPGLWLSLGVMLALKLAVNLSGSMSFNTDEALMAIIARHILEGARPIFRYRQWYMGTVDNYLMALVFLVLPQTIFTARIVSLVVYSGVVITTYALAWRLSRSRFAATAAGLLAGVPPVMVTLYTSMSLGAWIEILLLNNLLWLVGWDILSGRRSGHGAWALAGALAGVGWWELPLIITSAAPLALQGVSQFRRAMPWRKLGVMLGGFVVGALPWFIAFTGSANRIVADATGKLVAAGFTGDAVTNSWLVHLISPFGFNIPALVGLRPPWSLQWIAWPVGVLILALYVLILWRAAQRVLSGAETGYRRIALTSLLAAFVLILTLLVVSPFALDASGRYLLVLFPPLAVLTGDWLASVRQGEALPGTARQRWLASALLAALVAYNLYGNVRSMLWDPSGLTTQMAPIAHIPHDYDDDLIAFLDGIGVDRGYSNVWVMGRFAYLTGERVIMAPLLPYHEDMRYTYRDDKYPPYTEMVRAADEVVYVTSNHPQLDAAIRERFAARSIAYREEQIGPYTVFYDLPRNVQPEELGAFGEVTGDEIYDR